MSHSPPSNLAAMMQDLAVFRANWLIDAGDGPVVLDRAMDPWQRADYEALDPGWRVITGQARPSGQLMRAYLERPRGHSKTTDIAVQIAAALISSPTQITGIAAAADKDQGKLVRDAIARQVAANPWAADWLQVDAFRVSNIRTGASLEIISSDAASSYGQTPDFIVCDELTHWGDRGEELWTSLFSAAAKRGERCLLLIISNSGSGQGTSWQWRIRETARTSSDWYFSRLDGPLASWISPAQLSAQERMLPKAAFGRLWLNEWQSGAGDGIGADLIEAARKMHTPPLKSRPNWLVFGGLDLGLRRDAAAFVLVAADPERMKVVTLYAHKWMPPEGGEIDLLKLESELVIQSRYFNCREVLCDPWQSATIAQRLNTNGWPTARLIWPSVGNLDLQAQTVFEGFKSGIFELYSAGHGAELIHDLKNLSIVEKPGQQNTGYRLVPPRRNANGHSDLAAAWLMPATQAVIWLRSEESRVWLQEYERKRDEKQEANQDLWGRNVNEFDSPRPNLAVEYPRRRAL